MTKEFYYIVLFPRDNCNKIEFYNGHCNTQNFEETIYFSSLEDATKYVLNNTTLHHLNKTHVPNISVLNTTIEEMSNSDLDIILKEIDKQNERYTNNTQLQDGTGSSKYQKLANKYRDVCDLKCLSKEETWADIFKEEAYEVLGASSELELQNELKQVAALCLRWIYAIENR